MKYKKPNIGSLIVSILFGISFSWYLTTLILKLNIIESSLVHYFSYPLIIGFITLNALKNPRTTEFFAFVFSAWVALQFLWDLGAEQIFGPWRTIMTFSAIILFILNGFTGYLRFSSGFKILKKALGGN